MSVFVTGAPRTGTTLLDKLLSRHANAIVYSQPLPLLYVALKQRFLAAIGHPSAQFRYALNDMYLDKYYAPERFRAFLHDALLAETWVRPVLDSMVDYDGQYTKVAPHDAILADYAECHLDQFVSRYCDAIGSAAGDASCLIGSKESFCEEYIPYFLDCGVHIVQMIRDPRDSIASLSYGKGAAYSGARRPTLFNIRQWRKSAAFALEHTGQRRFLLLRYEDLVRDLGASLKAISAHLNLSPFPIGLRDDPLITHDGDPWLSNSSHHQTAHVSTASVGSHRNTLPHAERCLIEACCYHEMRALGYDTEIEEHHIEAILREHPAESPVSREALRDYAWRPATALQELSRLEAVRQLRYDPHLFLFSRAFESIAYRT